MKLLAIILALVVLASGTDARTRVSAGSTCPSPTTNGALITAPTPCTLTGTFGSVGISSNASPVNNTSGIATTPTNYDISGAGATILTSDGSSAGDNFNWNGCPLNGNCDFAMPVTQMELNNGGNLYLKYSLTTCPTAFPTGSPNPTALWFMQKPSGSSEAGFANWFQVSDPTSTTIPAITSSNGNTYPTILDAVKAGPAGATINVPVMPSGVPFYDDVASGRQSFIGFDGMTINFAAGVKVFCSFYGSKGTINISANNNTVQGDATVPAEIGNNSSGNSGNAYGISLDEYAYNVTLTNLSPEGAYDSIHGQAPGVSTFTNLRLKNGDMVRDLGCGGFGLGHNGYLTPGDGNATPNAAFTGSVSSTTLTASAVTGAIQPGGTITGGGIVAGTVILAQLTGTTNGAGTYQVSVSQTTSGAMQSTGTEDNDNFTLNGGYSINVLGDNDPALSPNGNNGGDDLKLRLRKGLVEHYTLGGNLTGVAINNLSPCSPMYYTVRWPFDMPCGGEWTIAHSTIELPANTTFFGGHEFLGIGDEISASIGSGFGASNNRRASGNCGPETDFVGDVLASNQLQLTNIPINPRVYGVDVGDNIFGYDASLNIFGFPNGQFESNISAITGSGPWTITITPNANGYGFPVGNFVCCAPITPSFTGVISGNTLTISVPAGGLPTLTPGNTLLDITGNIRTGTTIVSGSGATWVTSGAPQTVASESMTAPLLAACTGGPGNCGYSDTALGYLQATASITSGTNIITLNAPFDPTVLSPSGALCGGGPCGYNLASVGWQAEMSCLPAGTTIIAPRPTSTTILTSANATSTCTNQPLVLERKHSLTLDHDYIIVDAPNGGNDGINQLVSSYSAIFIPVTISNSVMVTNSGQFSISGQGCAGGCGQVVNGLTDPSVATVAAMNGNSVYTTRAAAQTAIGGPWSVTADQFGNPSSGGAPWPFLPQAP